MQENVYILYIFTLHKNVLQFDIKSVYLISRVILSHTYTYAQKTKQWRSMNERYALS